MQLLKPGMDPNEIEKTLGLDGKRFPPREFTRGDKIISVYQIDAYHTVSLQYGDNGWVKAHLWSRHHLVMAEFIDMKLTPGK